ncbi:lgl family protein [Schizosaccharomyces japonicus yFS275]|uniref:Lgl family protein n=1 Tax=Schizosaccharomyces japonicus (strain yFS275 / FY16936) TaxID=402676 RepID=B6K2V4_SCHJY|nr:lgl family protein [Schizosaccharomyces japonicus yFS275]EEB08594.1 lgl family protein [Schizosaccharomyces japonicus yFS275]
MGLFSKKQSKKNSADANDLSKGLENLSISLQVDDYNRFGVIGKPVNWYYDAAQELLALETSEDIIYIFGKGSVQTQYVIPPGVKLSHLVIHWMHLILIGTNNMLYSFDLTRPQNKDPVSSLTLHRKVTAIGVDSAVEWLYLGLQDGSVFAYDTTRRGFGSYRIENQYTERQEEWKLMGYPFAKKSVSAVQGIHINPKDLGLLLIVYDIGVVLYSLKASKALRYFELEFAPGSLAASFATTTQYRRPHVQGCVWSPWGTHFLCWYEDSVYAFWNVASDEPIQTKTFIDSNVHAFDPDLPSLHPVKLEPIRQMFWCVSEKLDFSYVLMMGGLPKDSQMQGVSLMLYKKNPEGIADVKQLTEYYTTPDSQRFFPFDAGKEPVSFLVIPSASPHYSGGHAPYAMLVLFEDGSILPLALPTGDVITHSSVLPPALALSLPNTKLMGFFMMSKLAWDSLYETTILNALPSLIRGGTEHPGFLRQLDSRSVFVTSRKLSLTLWNVSKGLISSHSAVYLDFSEVLESNLRPNCSFTSVSISRFTVELACADTLGRVLLVGRSAKDNGSHVTLAEGIAKIHDPFAVEGTIRGKYILDLKQGQVSHLNMSDIGFLLVGYTNGCLAIIDLRGPHISCEISLADFADAFRRKGKLSHFSSEHVTSSCFSVFSPDNKRPAQLYALVGSSVGRVYVFQISMNQNGVHEVFFEHAFEFSSSKIVSIRPVTQSGVDATADGQALTIIGSPLQEPIYISICSESSTALYQGMNQKCSSIHFNRKKCVHANILPSKFSEMGSLVCLHSDSSASWYTLPNLKEELSLKLPKDISVTGDMQNALLTNGQYILPTVYPNACALGSIAGTGFHLGMVPAPTIIVLAKKFAARPTISTWSWLKGEQYVSPEDLNLILAGPHRPANKIRPPKVVTPSTDQASSSNSSAPPIQRYHPKQKSIFNQLTDSLTKRGRILGGVEDKLEDLEVASSDWLKEIKAFANTSKNDVMLFGLKSYLP